MKDAYIVLFSLAENWSKLLRTENISIIFEDSLKSAWTHIQKI